MPRYLRWRAPSAGHQALPCDAFAANLPLRATYLPTLTCHSPPPPIPPAYLSSHYHSFTLCRALSLCLTSLPHLPLLHARPTSHHLTTRALRRAWYRWEDVTFSRAYKSEHRMQRQASAGRQRAKTPAGLLGTNACARRAALRLACTAFRCRGAIYLGALAVPGDVWPGIGVSAHSTTLAGRVAAGLISRCATA